MHWSVSCGAADRPNRTRQSAWPAPPRQLQQRLSLPEGDGRERSVFQTRAVLPLSHGPVRVWRAIRALVQNWFLPRGAARADCSLWVWPCRGSRSCVSPGPFVLPPAARPSHLLSPGLQWPCPRSASPAPVTCCSVATVPWQPAAASDDSAARRLPSGRRTATTHFLFRIIQSTHRLPPTSRLRSQKW